MVFLVYNALSAPLEHLADAPPDPEIALPWLDSLVVAAKSPAIRDHFGYVDDTGERLTDILAELVTLARDNRSLAAATGAPRWQDFSWMSDVMDRRTVNSWRQAVFTDADSVLPSQRLGCILQQALALWSSRERIGPMLPWIDRVARAPQEPIGRGVGIVARPYSAVPGLYNIMEQLRKQAFETLMTLKDPAPLQLWLDDPEKWWGDSRAMERRIREDLELLTRAFDLTKPRTPGRKTILLLAATCRPPPMWLASAALAEDQEAQESIASALGRWPQAATLWRHLARTAPDMPSRTKHLGELCELEPNCPEWPEHVAKWLQENQLPFGGTVHGRSFGVSGGGFLDLLRSARELSTTDEIAPLWRPAVLRMLALLPEAQRVAREELADASTALATIEENGTKSESWSHRRAQRAAKSQVKDLETAGTILLRALSELGDMARLNRYIEPFVEALQRGEEAADVPPDLVLDWIERLRPESVAAFVRDTGPLGDWIRRYFSGSSWPRLCGATADLWESRLTAAIEKAEDPDRFGITTALGWLSHIAPDRLNRATEMLLERLPEPWTVGVIWGECLHRDDDIGLAIRNRCLMAMTNANEKPLAK
jgi:hypothetical protein